MAERQKEQVTQRVDGHEGPSNGAATSRSAGIDRALARTSDAPLREGNRLVLLKNGPDTYEDWLAAIGRARRWIHLDNYIFENDEIGHRFADALSAKAAEGVRVRVLHDWFGSLDVPRSFWADLREAGVEVGAVNPPASGPPFGAIRRDHRKLIVVDGEYASTGGVCISDGWMVRSQETGLPYRDTAVSLRGPAVADIDNASPACGTRRWISYPTMSVPAQETSRWRGRKPCAWSSRSRAGCAPCACWSCSRPG